MELLERITGDGFHLSFEVFPPKQATSMANISRATHEIAHLHPAFMSVTYGAAGGSRDFTLELSRQIQEECGIPALAHLTCVHATREEILRHLRTMESLGLRNVMVLRGDRVAGGSDEKEWGYRHASELVREVRALYPGMCIGGACYPEVHPESSCQKEDLMHLREKVDLGCQFLTTQMFFDNSLLYAFLFRLREAGITVPVLPGVMPITSRTQVQKARDLSHAFLPRSFLALVDQFGSNDRAMCQAGIAYATEQIIDLFANGIHCVHVYTMNRPDVASAICRNLSSILS